MPEKKRSWPTLYREFMSVGVKGYAHSEIQGETVCPPTFPYKRLNGEVIVPVVPSPSEVLNNYPNFKGVYLDSRTHISPLHGRSYEASQIIMDGEKEHIFEDILVKDEFGNYFLGVSEKGNNLMNPHALRSTVSPMGFTVYGMQDSHSIKRVIKASKRLRELGVSTEVLNQAIQLQEVFYKGKVTPIDEFKQALIADVWKQDNQTADPDKLDMIPITRAEIPALGSYLDEIVFFVTERSMAVNERVSDFKYIKNKKDFQQLIKKIFNSLATIHKAAGVHSPYGASSDLYIEFHPKSPQDIEEYFSSFLPDRMMDQLAVLHEDELLHKYLHPGNVLADGGFCDLDSVVGKSLGLGDPDVDPQEQVDELLRLCREYYEVVLSLSTKRYVPFGFVHVVKRNSEEYSSPELLETQASMLVRYVYKRTKDLLPLLNSCLKFNKYFLAKFLRQGYVYEKFLTNPENSFFRHLESELNWSYTCTLTREELIERLFQMDIAVFKSAKEPHIPTTIEEVVELIMEAPENTFIFKNFIEKILAQDCQEKMKKELPDLAGKYHPDMQRLIEKVFVPKEIFPVLNKLFAPLGIQVEEEQTYQIGASDSAGDWGDS